MLRLLIIFGLIGYALHKLGLFRIVIQTPVRGQRPHDNLHRRPAGGNVNVDTAPPEEKKKSNFKGGEYVDYEEVK